MERPMSRGTPDLKIATTDLKFVPTNPAPGTKATVQAQVWNLGTSPATGGRVVLVLMADGREVSRREISAAVPAGGSQALQWPVGIPAGKVSVTATAVVTGDVNPNNNQARVSSAFKTIDRPKGTTVPTTAPKAPTDVPKTLEVTR
jgi:hypothetical protein